MNGEAHNQRVKVLKYMTSAKRAAAKYPELDEMTALLTAAISKFSPRRCQGCGRWLEPCSRPDKRYCNVVCKQKAYRERKAQ